MFCIRPFLVPPGRDATPVQVTPSIEFAGAIYTPGRGCSKPLLNLPPIKPNRPLKLLTPG